MVEAALKILSERQKGTVIPLPVGRFLIGREEDCQLRPNSELVSRHHCVFTNDEFTLRVRDLGSTNGTFVNGEPLRGGVVLTSGDRVTVGKIEFQVLLGEDVAAGGVASDGEGAAEAEPAGPAAVEDDAAAGGAENTTTGESVVDENAPVDETTTVVASETSTEIPAVAPPQPEAPQPQPAVGLGDTAFFPAPLTGYPPPGYAPQPPYPYAGYPPMYPPGYYPQAAPQPGAPYPQQGYPQQPPIAAPDAPAPTAPPGQAEEQLDVTLPDPSTTGAKPPEPAPEASTEDEKKKEGADQANVPQTAEGIIQQYLQRRPSGD